MNTIIHSTQTVETQLESVKVLVIPTLHDNYSYCLYTGDQAIIIDPSDFTPIEHELVKRNLHTCAMLITHEHHDHIGGVKKLYKKYKPQVFAARGASVPMITNAVTDDTTVTIGAFTIEAIFVPGHYSLPYSSKSINNNIAWYCKEAGVLFTGDTLFSCGYGYIKNEHEKMMWESLQKLRALPNGTLVFSGHEYTLFNTTFAMEIDPDNTVLQERFQAIQNLLTGHKPTVPTTLGLEKAINPFLRWDDSALKEKLKITDKDDFESFQHIRELKKEYNRQ